jgi:hypothetical protein
VTEAQREAFRRAALLLTDLLSEGWSWPARLPRTFQPWGSRDEFGIHISGVNARMTNELVAWFGRRGWIASSVNGDVYAAPLVEAALPESCFHTTPADNEAGIRESGLLRGAEAGRSTSGRPDAGRHIHVCFNPDDAAKWAEDKLLGKRHPGQEWVIFEIDRRGVEGKAYRDPASQTGYILEARSVAPRFLEVVRRLT